MATQARNGLSEAELTAKKRKELPKSAFALPGGRYPIHDESHARNALSRVAQHGTPEEKAKVRAAVCRRYPSMGVCKEAKRMKEAGLDPDSPEGATLLLERAFGRRETQLRRRLDEAVASKIVAAASGDNLGFISARSRERTLREMLADFEG